MASARRQRESRQRLHLRISYLSGKALTKGSPMAISHRGQPCKDIAQVVVWLDTVAAAALNDRVGRSPGLVLAEGDFVIAHGRFSGFGEPVNWIAADILRIEGGVLVEHWDVIQDEATKDSAGS
jgi:hypothetical protein